MGRRGADARAALEALEAEQRQLLSLVLASGNALATVINDILDFSKIEANMLHIDKS